MTGMKIVHSPKCEEYGHGGQAESPERVSRTRELLEREGFEFVEPEAASREDVLTVHQEGLVEKVANHTLSLAGGSGSQTIYDYALLSVGGALRAARFALDGQRALSLMRPPGHHASTNSYGGFCYLNNVAVAVQSALGEVERVAIVDIDCHHGDGTEDIFSDRSEVLYVSLHQSGIYPGTGDESRDHIRNFPLPPGTDPDRYRETLDAALEEVRSFEPELIAVSAGFDTYKEDPLTSLGLEVETYHDIGSRLTRLGPPLFAALEGGYSDRLPDCVLSFLSGLTSE
ncbi:MAG: histone deacetylase family protein [Nitriliruptorales bacterium]